MGTCHEPLPNYFALSRKDFETPLGLLSADNDFIDDLVSRSDLDLFADELSHRREHTIEFQTLFLKPSLISQMILLTWLQWILQMLLW